VSTLRTTIAEVVTGLGMTGLDTLDEAIAHRPVSMANIGDDEWTLIEAARDTDRERELFERSWANGRAFFEAPEGLRGRVPLRIEWKGDHRPVGYDAVPADLRVDHVYLISCKDESRILQNPAPAHLVDRLLAERHGDAGDWYDEVAPGPYRELWWAVRAHLGEPGLPDDPCALDREQREAVKESLGGRVWPAELQEPYGAFCTAVSAATADRWRLRLDSQPRRETMYWRLVRLAAAPYFLLGGVRGRPIRLRVGTPWDWRQHFHLLSFTVGTDPGAGQPVVTWRAEVRERTSLDVRRVEGHVEVRWSKGRFRRPPEAKVYLDSPHEEVPGYFPIR
jgi:hypothetical protein